MILNLKPIILVITLLVIQIANADDSLSEKSNDYKYFTDEFIEHISNSEFDEAYLMLSSENKKRISKYQFEIYFEGISKYYGEIKSYKCEIGNGSCFEKDDNIYIGSYQIEFTDTKAKVIFTLIINDDEKPKINYYLLIHNNDIKLKSLYHLAKKPLMYLKKGDYKNLYNLIPRVNQLDTYDEFLAKIKKLEVNGKMRFYQVRHEILVFRSILDIGVVYNFNDIGEIKFEYHKKGDQIKLSKIWFKFTKELKEKYEADLANFIDSIRVKKEIKILSSKDSLQFKKKFDKILEEKEEAEIAKILEEDDLKKQNKDSISIGISYDWKQIDDHDQKLIKSASEQYLRKLTNNDIDGLWNICHSKLKEITPKKSFNEFISPITGMITSDEIVEFIDGKKVTYSIPPKTSKLVTGGSLEKSNPTYLQFYTYPGIENQALTLYKISDENLSRIITMKFGLEDSNYKLTSFEINATSIKNKDASYYFKLSKKWESNKSFIPQFIALNMAYRLSYLGRGTSTNKMIEIKSQLNNLQKKPELVEEIEKWNINDTIFDVINLDFLETKSDITLNIKYISKNELERKLIEKETEKLYRYLKQKYPDLVMEFNRLMFTAYKENPSNPFVKYDYYRVIKNYNE